MIINLPEFDTGQYEGCDFLMTGGNARLVIKFSETPDFIINFDRVRWHQFTALPNCTVEMLNDSYFELIEVNNSIDLKQFLIRDRSIAKAYTKLIHYRIFLDETGCHEVFAQNASSC
ncbi:MAG: hypothetical protein H7Z73_05495 [Candidatus Saccharibacteria bacterium]|nr:hypothetical protein [Moraxellaceae bacterium]